MMVLRLQRGWCSTSGQSHQQGWFYCCIMYAYVCIDLGHYRNGICWRAIPHAIKQMFSYRAVVHEPRRQHPTTLHALAAILTLTILATICGAHNWVEIAQWGQAPGDRPHGIPPARGSNVRGWPGWPPHFRPRGTRRGRCRKAWGKSLDGGREAVCASCCRRANPCWMVAASAATRASRGWRYSRTARGVCSPSAGGKGGVVCMGRNHT